LILSFLLSRERAREQSLSVFEEVFSDTPGAFKIDGRDAVFFDGLLDVGFPAVLVADAHLNGDGGA